MAHYSHVHKTVFLYSLATFVDRSKSLNEIKTFHRGISMDNGSRG